MRSLQRFPLAIVLMLAPLGGCDGRGGSSGFDVNGENAAISQALERHQCLDFQALTICPADEPATGPSVETPLATATSIDCFQALPGGSCTFALSFVARAFSSGTTFEVLSRAGGSSNPWVLGTDPVPESSSEASSYTATLVLTSPQGGPPSQVQLAVLAFAGPSPSSPIAVSELHQTAATFAFVTQTLAVNVLTPTPTTTATRRPTNTPTATSTAGASDCCQCPSRCAAPVAGTCDSGCTVVFGTSCFGEQLCVLRTPTPTVVPALTPTPCLKDNGDGTITDGCTGLTWEKKDQAGGLHDYRASYPWAGECDDPLTRTLCQPDAVAAAACAAATNGAVGCSQCSGGDACRLEQGRDGTASTTVWGWLEQLNQGGGFAGHTDWRLPSVGKEGDTAELETIILSSMCTVGSPCVSPAFNTKCPMDECDEFRPCSSGLICPTPAPGGGPRACQSDPGCTVTSCSCTQPFYYWSVTTDISTPGISARNAWFVEFAGGAVISFPKTGSWFVRAVRGMTTPTPTRTPGANDCCQCPSSCAAPVDGACSGCPVVAGAACDGGQRCALHTPTPTPTPCLKDNGDGTITDGCRGLIWEKKDQAGGLHDYATLYTWAGACPGGSALCQPNAEAAATCARQTGGAEGCSQCASGTCVVDPDHNGAVTTIWDWLNQLNASTFAGYNDWRVPTVGFQGDMAELETILLPTTPPCGVTASVPLVFNANCTSGCTVASCSCTQTTLQDYWSATTFASQPGLADGVNFRFCGAAAGAGPKTNANSIRAVRGGF